MDEKLMDLEDCPDCRGTGVVTHEGGWCVYVECSCCGAHTTYVEYNNEEEKAQSEKVVVSLWNRGKVIHMNPGE